MCYFSRILFCFVANVTAVIVVFPDTAFGTSTHELSGKIRITKVSDGDSLRSGNLRIRIFGVDAPELKQTCQEQNGVSWPCGLAAHQKLTKLIGADKTLQCAVRDVDRYGRLVMQCFKGVVDVGAEMVRSGHALAYRAFTKIYIAEEHHARSAHRGVWRGTFLSPWEWRRQN